MSRDLFKTPDTFVLSDAIAVIEAEFSKESDLRSHAIRERLDRAKSYYSKLLTATEQALRE